MQRCGVEEVSKALESEDVTLLLYLMDSSSSKAKRLRKIAEQRGIAVREASMRDMWRMARVNENQTPPPILALVGREPSATVEDVLESGGVSWLIASGAKAVVVDGDLSHSEKKAAKRASMKAHRFMPVHWVDGDEIVGRARDAGFRVLSLEDSGPTEPWEADLTGDVLLVVGGEHDGIPQSILEKSDSVIRVPMSGFVPSYNLQAPMAVVAAEAIRQRGDG